MSYKRDYSDLDDGEIPEPTPKRAKQQPSKSSRQHQNSGIDPTWGQKYVFSNQDDATTIPYGEESDFEDDADAMAYLASVRQEAYTIPQLLVAPKVQIGPQLPADLQTNGDNDDDDEAPVDRSIYDEEVADSRGWYEDGAYMARPDSELDEGVEDEDADDRVAIKAVQEAYFASLLDSFSHLRQIVHGKPPSSAKLPPGTSTFAAASDGDSRATRLWSGILRKSDPNPIQVARLSKPSVLRILRIILGGKFLRQGYTVEERTSRWLWALLARLPDRGELDYAEIGWIRDLGRRAVLLGRSLSEMAALREELEEGALGLHDGVDGSSSDEEDADVSQVNDSASNAPATGTISESQAGFELGKTDTINKEDQDEAIIIKGVADPKGEASVEEEQEEGEIEEEDDVAMDIASNSSADEAPATNLDDAKARLLERLAKDEHVDAAEAAKQRSRINMRATLNMILTVAGEFYGQRDLLEFREPFVGL